MPALVQTIETDVEPLIKTSCIHCHDAATETQLRCFESGACKEAVDLLAAGLNTISNRSSRPHQVLKECVDLREMSAEANWAKGV